MTYLAPPLPIKASLISLLLLLMSACGGDSNNNGINTGASPGTQTSSQSSWQSYEREQEYSGFTTLPLEYIVLRDGIRLAAHVSLPTDVEGSPVTGPLPVILTQTGYNSSLGAIAAPNAHFIQRGYAHVNVDVRGTGNSEGVWDAWGPIEQEDYAEVMEWVATQPWSNGNVGTWGPSFMAITQLLTARHNHPAHKALFTIVPPGDVYRDITFAGGQINGAFVPAWLYLVTGLSLIPAKENIQDPALFVKLLTEHATNSLIAFQTPTFVGGLTGFDDKAYSTEFWSVRSPLTHIDEITIPTFVLGGLRDIFQRSEPMTYEGLKNNTNAKLLIGPWDHLQGSQGAGLPADGVPSMDNIALAWFDHYLKGMDNGAEVMPKVTQYLYGEERYAVMEDWPHPQARAERWHLRGGGSLTQTAADAGESANMILQQPVGGICSDSTAQWSAGILGVVPLPCYEDNRIAEALEFTYTSTPMEQDYFINGPIQADLWISTTALDAGVVVRVTDVAPDGVSKQLTSGLLTASARALDSERSRFLDGQMIQPWHLYTQESRETPGLNQIVPINVEIFSTSAVIKEGHALRISVGASDFPRGIPPVLDLLDQLAGLLTIYSDAEHPSSVVFPIVPISAIPLASE
jgi:putative CocE/NonD family hydrolase